MEIEARRILPADTMLTAALVLMLSSCAGRAPNPVSVSQPQDATYSCEEIEAETAANIETIAHLQSEDNQKVGQNVTNGILGFVFPPFWLFMDFQGAAGVDLKAMEARNTHLADLAVSRCDVAGAPSLQDDAVAAYGPTEVEPSAGADPTAARSR